MTRASSTERGGRTLRTGLVVLTLVAASAFPAGASGATFTVNDAGDGAPDTCAVGTCTLREAITDANATLNVGGPDVIDESFAAQAVDITPTSPLPPITEAVTINALHTDNTAAVGTNAIPGFEIIGTNAGAAGDGLVVAASGVTIRNVGVRQFTGTGIVLNGANNLVAGCFIGTDDVGTTDLSNGDDGIRIAAGVGNTGNTIGGGGLAGRNLIVGHNNTINSEGVEVLSGSNKVKNSLIGIRKDATANGIPNRNGVRIDGSNNRIGIDADAAEANVISLNQFTGVTITSGTGNQFFGNLIGVTGDGTADAGNGTVGVNLGVGADATQLGGDDPALERNVISGNNTNGVFVGSAGNFIRGNRIGTSADGMTAIPNTNVGVDVFTSGQEVGGGAAGEGNLISGNGLGVRFTNNLDGIRLKGNVIGLAADGTTALPNGGGGVSVQDGADNVQIGGTAAGEGNTISNNTGIGVTIREAGTTGNTVQGNLIGTDTAGALDKGNTEHGVQINNSASGNTIGGTAAGARNVISGNDFSGIDIENAADGNVVEGNYMGLGADGSTKIGNNGPGVFLDAGSTNRIGGVGTAARNVISGNGGVNEVEIGLNAAGGLVQGNFIGPTAGGTAPTPANTAGALRIQTNNVTVGGTAPGAGNLIAFNPSAPLRVASGSGNRILGNSIHSNAPGSNEIDLDPANVTPNDPAPDSDVGPNGLQNYPDINAAVGGSNPSIQGSLASEPNEAYRLEFFSDTSCATADPRTFLGTIDVTTDGAGNASFEAPIPVAPGSAVVATATDSAGNTSEESVLECVVAASPSSLSVGDVNVTEGNSGDTTAEFTVSLSGASPATVRVDFQTVDGTASSTNPDYEAKNGTVVFAPSDTSETVTVNVKGDQVPSVSEDFFIDLSNPRAAEIGDGRGRAVIGDDDGGPVGISVGDVSVNEGRSGTTQAAIPVSLAQPTEVPVLVDFATANGTARAPSDYAPASGQLTIPEGATGGVLNVAVNGDRAEEPNETVRVALANPQNAVLADGEGLLTIRNDDRTKPKVKASKVGSKCKSRDFRVKFTITDESKVTSTVTRGKKRVGRSGKKTFRLKVKIRGLRPGRYRLKITVVDALGNRTSKTIRFRVC